MVNAIRPTGVSPVSPVSGGGGDNGSRTGGALRRLAGKVAGRMAREFKLFDQERDNEESDQFREGEDIYAISETARELTTDLGGRPTDEGRLARSLDGFVQESASLMAARPEAASLDTIARLIVANEQSEPRETIDGSLRQIDQTARDIAESKPR